jgi:membrane associated rhomboid family serine protease
MNDPFAACTLLLIGVTCVVSYLGFHNRDLEARFIFDPESILAGKEYHRLVTSALLHANWFHLAMNMVTLYLFGRRVELLLGKEQFLLIYLGAVVGGGLLALFVHRNHVYRAYGASGGVCGVLFAYLLLFPGSRLYAFPLPFAVPGWLYALAFIPASFYGMKTNRGNVGHDAHLGGAIVGLLLAAALSPWAVTANLKVFLIVLVSAVLLLLCLWLNPLFLPWKAFFESRSTPSRRLQRRPTRRLPPVELDQVLDKIHKQGIESLTNAEKQLLAEVSAQHRRRAESKKPDSGLAI